MVQQEASSCHLLIINYILMRTLFTIKLSAVMLSVLVFSLLILLPSHVLGVPSGECLAERNATGIPACQSVDVGALGFRIPSLADILTFAIRAFFAIAGIAALFYMLIGAFGWVTSGGDKDSITAARERIQAAVVGMILIVAVLAIIWTLEQVIFKRRVCLGLSCPVTLPGLIETTSGQKFCCSCTKPDGSQGDPIDAYEYRCNDLGIGELLAP